MATTEQIPLIMQKLGEFQKDFGKLSPQATDWLIENPQEGLNLLINALNDGIGLKEEPARKLGRTITSFRILPIPKKFIAKEKFLINTKNEKQVRISHISDAFKEWFWDKVEDEFPGCIIVCRNLQDYAGDDVIIAEIGGRGKAITSLREVFYLMEAWSQQRESGLICKETIDHIFYVRDVKGIIRAIRINWSQDGWSLNAFPLEYSEEWEVNSRIFYRHSLRD